jgi:6-phosphogluconolactonase
MIPRDILVFDDRQWVSESAKIISKAVENICKLKGSCNLMLTGGRSAEKIYKEWTSSGFLEQNKINFYFGDERCVPLADSESNYRMAIDALLAGSKKENITIYPVNGDAVDKEKEAKRYEALLPCKIDILLLSIGEDGHIASLFPQDKLLIENERKMMLVKCPKKPFSRISISPVVIRSAGKIFCFGQGSSKGKALAAVFKSESEVLKVPAKLAVRGTWLLDRSAQLVMNQYSMV